MSFLRFLPRRLQRRIRDYAPRGFPDVASCGAFYEARARLFREDEGVVLEYTNRDVQRRLFERAVEALPPHGRVLDVGCGFGHLFDFLVSAGGGFDSYSGIDVSPTLIEATRSRIGSRPGVLLEQRDLTRDPLPEKSHDVAYLISVLGYPIGRDPMKTMMTILGTVFRACTDGLAFSHVMSGRRTRPLAFPTDPQDLAVRCEREFGARATLHDDGVDFTYFLSLRHEPGVAADGGGADARRGVGGSPAETAP